MLNVNATTSYQNSGMQSISSFGNIGLVFVLIVFLCFLVAVIDQGVYDWFRKKLGFLVFLGKRFVIGLLAWAVIGIGYVLYSLVNFGGENAGWLLPLIGYAILIFVVTVFLSYPMEWLNKMYERRQKESKIK